MKKIILLIILIFTVIGCAEIEEMNRERRERGRKCVYNQYGNIECGYKSPPRN